MFNKASYGRHTGLELILFMALVFFYGCDNTKDVLIVKGLKTDSLHFSGFDSVIFVDKVDEELLRLSGHLLIQTPVAEIDFQERSYVERYLQAGGAVTFSCIDTIYNWGQLKPFLNNDQVIISCGEYDLVKSDTDYTNLTIPAKPGMDRLVREVLVAPLREPVALAVTDESIIYWIERKGRINMYDLRSGKSQKVDSLAVYTGEEDGLLGIALDPEHYKNQWAYLFYSPPGDIAKQHVSRFKLTPDGLDRASEKVLLEIPTQREECCHSAGDLIFDDQGNLYISVGDNTFSRASDGFTPLDERPGRKPFDSQRTSGNTNDLRGKILRIHPEQDGTYTIPEGNLFPKDGSAGLAEIFVMGARNPFTMAIHPDRNWLYWGDVGPDGNVTSERGPSAYDEINLAKEPGNYGWPYFNANNIPYADYDFATGELGPLFDPENPKNTSANNTGSVELPPAKPAMVYYTFDETPQFPKVGKGSRSVGVGEIYNFEEIVRIGHEFPEYYKDKLFAFDWARDWIMVITQDRKGNFQSIEPFLDNTVLASPIDMAFGIDGSLYVLEYGIGYFTDNRDSKLIRLSFVNGNRPPVAQLNASATNGRLPLTVSLSATNSYDPDEGSQLSYSWKVQGPQEFTFEGIEYELTLNRAGKYIITLQVNDEKGLSSDDMIEITAGNTAPKMNIKIRGNETFFWPGRAVEYEVEVNDYEDGTLNNGINSENVRVSMSQYAGSDNRAPGSLDLFEKTEQSTSSIGLQLISSSDCKSCHKIKEKSIGPSFHDIAERYDQDYMAADQLAKTIIDGGTGNWGDGVMIGHPDISMKAAKEIVKYIFSVNDRSEADDENDLIDTQGGIATSDAAENLRIEASYSDRGGVDGNNNLKSAVQKTLVRSVLQAEMADYLHGFSVKGEIEDGNSRYIESNSLSPYMVFKNIDLTNIDRIQLDLSMAEDRQLEEPIEIEIMLNSVDGRVVGTSNFLQKNGKTAVVEVDASGVHDVYINFKYSDQDIKLNVDQLRFYPNQEEGTL